MTSTNDSDHTLIYKLLAHVSPEKEKMLLLHQVGSVKIGEVVRYTVTYTPSRDRILPSPDVLHLRIRNTTNIALRAAFVHGPYTLNVAAYPSHFDPNKKFENPRRYGVPEFEPMLKAGGTWTCQLTVPDDIRESAGLGASRGDFGAGATEEKSASWVIEVASQVIFSSSAAVGYEVLLARDEKSFNLGSTPVIGGQAQVPQPGKVNDFQQSVGAKDGHHPAQPRGIFSRAVRLKVDDTAGLWNTPRLPGWDDWDHRRAKLATANDAATTSVTQPQSAKDGEEAKGGEETKKRKSQKVHLVVLTHGLHSNLGVDMLYLKESIDATVKQAKIDAKARRAREKAERDAKRKENQSTTWESQKPKTGDKSTIDEEEEDETENEEVIVRGFSGNATRTERGIKFLGKRLAKFILSMTYPDQPFLPSMKTATESITGAFTGGSGKDGKPAHKHSTIHLNNNQDMHRAFQITSISFIGHSLGGLVQTYAIAYMQKHSPQFFDLIRPVNFITMASPLLGLSNENPLYVKFALDFGLVGRTGQDLGLTWRAPTIARSGWGAIVGSLGETAHKKVMGEVQPESKPLLRILPTGPAHSALKKFRNRTVYSNVVNDGIVPLRTSCLLFLDWQGLGRVEKARRDAGLVESVIGFGWAELTGTNVTSPRRGPWSSEPEQLPSISNVSSEPETEQEDSREVPQPADNATVEDERQSLNLAVTPYNENGPSQNAQTNNEGPLSSIWKFFNTNSNDSQKSPSLKSAGPKSHVQKSPPPSPREKKIYQRSQTLKVDNSNVSSSASSSKSKVTAGHELTDEHESGVSAPPRTTFFESANDLLNPKLPTVDYLIDPSKRPRTIFHDRIYHPSDIPPPPLKKRPAGSLAIRRKSFGRKSTASLGKQQDKQQESAHSGSSSPYQIPKPGMNHEDSQLSACDYDDASNANPDRDVTEEVDGSSMRVEEKIARAYHKGLSWRKVLVKLEPDAHNNIIVRRMFANAHGWPVVHHLVDAHFSDSAAARMRDEDEVSTERAKALSEPPSKTGGEITTQEESDSALKPKQMSVSSVSTNGGIDGSEDNMELHGLGLRPRPRPSHKGHTLSEAREAEDAVPDLPDQLSPSLHSSQSHAGYGPNAPPRPSWDRLDSVTWSDRDFADSGDESDGDTDMAYGIHAKSQEEKGKEVEGKQTSSPVWNWTEKIVGKSSAGRRSCGQGQGPKCTTTEGEGAFGSGK